MFKVIKKIIEYPRLTQDYPAKEIDSRLFIGKPEVNNNRCTGCEACIEHCPSHAIVKQDSGKLIGINYDSCIFCSLCEEICPHEAIIMTNKFELAERNRNALRANTLVVKDKGTLCADTLVVKDDDIPADSEKQIDEMLKKKVNEVFGRSLHIREVDSGSCNACDYEINALNNPFNDIERLGIHFVASPRHADMLLVTGTAARNMEQALIKTYHAAPDPKLVVAVGACACSGGIFQDSYATRNGIDSIVPVDVYIPGCPPRPQAILYGILKALDRV